MFKKAFFSVVLFSLCSGAFAGECTMSFAALSQFDDFETSFYDRKNKNTIEVESANECASKATSKLGTKRKFNSENRFNKRSELRTIAIVNYTFKKDDLNLKGKVELTREPSSFF